MLDLVIRGGTLVDGSGAAPVRRDVGIAGGVIVEIGERLTARATIDADGALVTPGFVDLHTHYDGQATWDDALLPASAHGATTVVMGSCGVGFAPCRPADRERLVALMEGVEDIPGSALAEGLPWDWDSFASYLAAIDRRPHTLDLACHVPHDAVRVYAMGERGLAGEPATDDDAAAIGRLVREAVEAGAVGFSTGRSDNHRNADGRTTPAADADARELAAIGRALRGLPHGVLQAVSDFDLAAGPDHFDAEFDLLEELARTAQRPLSISLLQRVGATDQWRRILARIEAANAQGLALRAQVATRGIGVLLGLDATFHPFIGFPSYKALAHLPLAERVRELARPEVRARILAERSDRVAGDGSPVPPLVDTLLAAFDLVAMSLFRLADRPDYEPRRADSLFARRCEKARGPSRSRTTRCSRTAASGCCTSRSTTTRRARCPRSARCCATRTRCSASATAAPTSARSATRRSRPTCSLTGSATAASCRSSARSTSSPASRRRGSGCTTAGCSASAAAPTST